MTGRTHQLIGLATAVGACQATHQTALVSGGTVLAATIASRLPDRLECSGLIPHRTVTHMPALILPLLTIATLIAAITCGPAGLILGTGAAAGYATHLAADACTIWGIPGWPVRHRLHLLPRAYRIRTGGAAEALLATVIVCALLADAYLTYRR